jgi:hypothetical protein
VIEHERGQQVKRYRDPREQIVRHRLPDECGQLGALRSGPLVADYTFHNPDSDHWIAVSVVSAADAVDAPLYTPHMLVGVGASRVEAVSDLQQCLDDLVEAACD